MFKLEIYSCRNCEKQFSIQISPQKPHFDTHDGPVGAIEALPSLQETLPGLLGRALAFGTNSVVHKPSENGRNPCGGHNLPKFHIFRTYCTPRWLPKPRNPFQSIQINFRHPQWNSIAFESAGIALVDPEIHPQVWNSNTRFSWHPYRRACLLTNPSKITTELTRNSDNSVRTHIGL